MNANEITRVPNKNLPGKSALTTYRLPGGGGFRPFAAGPSWRKPKLI